jgi:ABC-type thiamin/hydroxymethylpyrimidine transport system permease subunit
MIIAAIVVSGTLGSLTNWLFMGLLFHAAYNGYLEIWRPGTRDGGDRTAIIKSTVLGYAMTAGMGGLCIVAHTQSIAAGLVLAVLAWIAGPLVVIVINGFFTKIDAKIIAAHCLGYLARMLLAGTAVGLALERIATQ